MTRQPMLTRELIRACESAMVELSDHRSAPVWLHLGAVVQHARACGLIANTNLVAALEELATLNEALADFASFNIPEADARVVQAHWEKHSIVDGDAARRHNSYQLGDLYQALSKEAREARALCQTPYWVSELLLHVAYERAVEEWDEPRIIDPACGTGHILIEALAKKLSEARRNKPQRDAATALDSIAGVDLDPYAANVARYRLLARTCVDPGDGLRDLPVHVAAADSLLADDEPLLARGRYHVVIANPPYITPKEAKAREAIRARYREVCLGKYSLALPFTVLMTELAVEGGYIAQLTTNAWMKREYGRRFVTDFLPRYEIVWVINCAGAYIPGHGTPTCILVHRNLPASGTPATAIFGKRGEPSTPDDPAEGLVWGSIRDAVIEHEAVTRLERRLERDRQIFIEAVLNGLRPLAKVRPDDRQGRG